MCVFVCCMNFHLSSHSQPRRIVWIWQDSDSDNTNTIFNVEYALAFELLAIYSKNRVLHRVCCTLSVAATWKLSSASLTKVKEGIAYSGQCLLSKLVIRQINIALKLFLRKDELDYIWTCCLLSCFRATQYACALVKYLLRNEAKRKELVKKLHFLESNMSSGRKRKNERLLSHNKTITYKIKVLSFLCQYLLFQLY